MMNKISDFNWSDPESAEDAIEYLAHFAYLQVGPSSHGVDKSNRLIRDRIQDLKKLMYETERNMLQYYFEHCK